MPTQSDLPSTSKALDLESYEIHMMVETLKFPVKHAEAMARAGVSWHEVVRLSPAQGCDPDIAMDILGIPRPRYMT